MQANEARQAHAAVKLCGWDAKARPGEAVNTLLQYQDVDVHGSAEKARTMWDTGSNSVLITHNFARTLRLKPEKIVYYLQSVDHAKERREGNFYRLSLVSMDGKRHHLMAYGVDKIMGDCSVPDTRSVRSLFPHVPLDVFKALPNKDVDLLVGCNHTDLLPSGGQGRNSNGKLRVLESRFGLVWVMT